MVKWGVHHTAQQTCFFRKSLYDKVGGLDMALHCAMDTELWLRMFNAGSTWGHIPEYLAAFRLHETAKGSAWLKEYAEEKIVVHGRWPQYLETPRRHIGLPLYRMSQILSLRHPRALWESRKNRGRKLTDVFGDWGPPVPPRSETSGTTTASPANSPTVSVPA
jgi:hypothetical protein